MPGRAADEGRASAAKPENVPEIAIAPPHPVDDGQG